jgi:hypothetical protein
LIFSCKFKIDVKWGDGCGQPLIPFQRFMDFTNSDRRPNPPCGAITGLAPMPLPHFHVTEGMIGTKETSSLILRMADPYLGYLGRPFSQLRTSLLTPDTSHPIVRSPPPLDPRVTPSSSLSCVTWEMAEVAAATSGSKKCPDPGLLLLLFQPW